MQGSNQEKSAIKYKRLSALKILLLSDWTDLNDLSDIFRISKKEILRNIALIKCRNKISSVRKKDLETGKYLYKLFENE